MNKKKLEYGFLETFHKGFIDNGWSFKIISHYHLHFELFKKDVKTFINFYDDGSIVIKMLKGSYEICNEPFSFIEKYDNKLASDIVEKVEEYYSLCLKNSGKTNNHLHTLKAMSIE